MSSIPKLAEPLAAPRARPLSPTGIALLVVLIALFVPLAYWRTTQSMVQIWERSETFAHGFLVFPIFAWLVWRERYRLAAISARPFLPALLGIALAGAAWWIAERLSAVGPTQFAMMSMVPFAVWAILGTGYARALAFPLAFLFFAVPMGEFLVPPMMDWTADFTVAALRASGVPVYRELNYLTIPTGMWSVEEACSGLRYLIASLMVGVLFAQLTYRSRRRRLAFIAASIAVPVVANWVRAYMIVMLGHLSDNRIAVGIDHVIYGWVFFGVVMLLLLSIGARWREPDAPAPVAPGPREAREMAPGRSVLLAMVAAAAVAVVWLPLAAAPARTPGAAPSLAPLGAAGGWMPLPEPASKWRPGVSGQSAELHQTFTKDGQRVTLHLLFFSHQVPGSQAISSRNQLVRGKEWMLVAASRADVPDPAGPLTVRTGVVQGREERLAAWQWLWIDGRVTTSDYVAELYRLLGFATRSPDTAAWIVAATPTSAGEPEARRTLADFVAAMRPAIDAALRDAGVPTR